MILYYNLIRLIKNYYGLYFCAICLFYIKVNLKFNYFRHFVMMNQLFQVNYLIFFNIIQDLLCVFYNLLLILILLSKFYKQIIFYQSFNPFNPNLFSQGQINLVIDWLVLGLFIKEFYYFTKVVYYFFSVIFRN